MKIQSIQSYYQRNNYKQPSFQAFKRTVKRPETGEVLWKNNTGFYRIDMSWTYLAEFLKEKYSGVEKVFVYNYASSNGLEAYTLLMELLANNSKDEVDKFMPIIAKDVDEFAIKMANKKLIDISECEKQKINKHTDNHFDDYFEEDEIKKGKYRPKEKLTANVIFSVGDFTEEYEKLPKDNVIILARNCWPYFPNETKHDLPQKLYEHLGKNVTLITGNFDSLGLGFKKFKNSGFKRTYIPYVYEK